MTREEQFWSLVAKRRGNGCWLWTGPKHPRGYGQFRFVVGESPKRAHRVAYELLVGPIPEGQVVHHRCGNPSCVRPAHLVALSQRDHLREHATDVCARGHRREPFPADGGPRPQCRACQRVNRLSKRNPRVQVK